MLITFADKADLLGGQLNVDQATIVCDRFKQELWTKTITTRDPERNWKIGLSRTNNSVIAHRGCDGLISATNGGNRKHRGQTVNHQTESGD